MYCRPRALPWAILFWPLRGSSHCIDGRLFVGRHRVRFPPYFRDGSYGPGRSTRLVLIEDLPQLGVAGGDVDVLSGGRGQGLAQAVLPAAEEGRHQAVVAAGLV